MLDPHQNSSEGAVTEKQQEDNGDAQKDTLQSSSGLICGVEREFVEAFLHLIQEKYRKADEATFFLEQRTGISNIQGIANVRDVLSHLSTLLNPNTPRNKRADQIANAEEHLRRAIIEPYETAVNEITFKFRELYQNYKQKVLPIKHSQVLLYEAPESKNIEDNLHKIEHLVSIGRAAKGKNIWTTEWEAGVASFIDAYNELSSLYSEVEGYWYKYEQLENDLNQKKYLENLSNLLEVQIQESKSNRKKILLLIFAVFAITLIATVAVIVAILRK